MFLWSVCGVRRFHYRQSLPDESDCAQQSPGALVKRAGVSAGLPFQVHPHQLRHACGYALATRAPIRVPCKPTWVTRTSSTRCARKPMTEKGAPVRIRAAGAERALVHLAARPEVGDLRILRRRAEPDQQHIGL